MAIIDERTEFADAVSVAAAAGTANIGDVIDSSVVSDLGRVQPVYLVINVDTEIITGGAAGTLKFRLVSDATGTIATDGSATVHVESPAYVTDGTDANAAQLKAGAYPLVMALPGEGAVYERYLAVQAVTATTTTTAGAINAYLTLDPPTTVTSYPDAAN